MSKGCMKLNIHETQKVKSIVGCVVEGVELRSRATDRRRGHTEGVAKILARRHCKARDPSQ